MNLPLRVVAVVLSLGCGIAVAETREGPRYPLTEFPKNYLYKGERGGLYEEGRNEPPGVLYQASQAASRRVEPLNADGKPAATGRIGLIAIGMSNTAIEFKAFEDLVRKEASHNPQIVLVNGAQGGRDSADWANKNPQSGPDSPWKALDRRVRMAGLTNAQVQVAWVLHARRKPAGLGGYPAHAKALEADLFGIIETAMNQFPNVRIIYLSSRNYAGYARNALNPEPYAYETAFAVRRVIAGKKKGPVVLWGPYLWANGKEARSDGLVWTEEDFSDKDGTHPSPSGSEKTARMLLEFFRSDPSTQSWWKPK